MPQVDPKMLEEFEGVRAAPTPDDAWGVTDASLRVSDDMSEYAAGDINGLQLAGRMLGETGSVFGGILAAPVNAALGAGFGLLPDSAQTYIKQGVSDIAQGVMETDAAQMAKKYLDENPETARDLSAMSGMLDLVPAAAMVARGGGGVLLNSLADNYKTHNEGWYSGNPVEKAKGVMKNLPGAAAMSIKTQFSPKERAIAREVGTGSRRIDEAIDLENVNKKRTREGNINASGYLADQMGRQNTLVQTLPTYVTAQRSVHDAGDFGGIVSGSKADFPDDIPDSIAEDLVQRGMNTLDAPAKRLEKVAASALDPRHRGRGRNPNGTQVVIRDTDAPTSRLQAEATGGTGGVKSSAAISQAFTKNGLTNYAKAVGKAPDNMDINDYKDFFHTASLFEGHMKGIRKELGGETAMDYAYRKVKGKNRREIPDLAYKGAGELMELYFKGKARARRTYKDGRPYQMTEQQAAVVKAIDGLKTNHSPNLTIDNVGGKPMLKYRTSFNSAEQELGGVSVGMTFDPSTKKMYTQITDGHDIFGADPSGGKGLYTLSPIQVRSLGGVPKKGQAGRESTRVREKQDAAIAEVTRRTGVEPTFNPKTGALNAKEFESAALAAARDQAQATRGDYARSAGTGMLTGMAFTGNQPEEQ